MQYIEKSNNINKTAFVIGGLGLIGLEAAKALSDSGAKVVIIDIKKPNVATKNLLKEKKIDFEKIVYKSDGKFFKKDFFKIIKKYSTPDIFINSAYPKTKNWKKNNFSKIAFKELKENIDLHLIFFCWFAKLVADQMKNKKKFGSIIQIGSIYGLFGQDMSLYKETNLRENVSYSIIKGGIINFTRQMAAYYGKYKIRVNNICPGGVYNKKDKNLRSKKFLQRYKDKSPLGTLAEASDIASAVLFLSSDSSRHMTGQTLVIDGGISII